LAQGSLIVNCDDGDDVGGAVRDGRDDAPGDPGPKKLAKEKISR
jgi:hypothetical protein